MVGFFRHFVVAMYYQRWIDNIDTSLKNNIAPEKGWLEEYFPFGKVTFQGGYIKIQGVASSWRVKLKLLKDVEDVKKNLENIQIAHWIFVIREVSS